MFVNFMQVLGTIWKRGGQTIGTINLVQQNYLTILASKMTGKALTCRKLELPGLESADLSFHGLARKKVKDIEFAE